jgi:peptide/nickel transport system permease protein
MPTSTHESASPETPAHPAAAPAGSGPGRRRGGVLRRVVRSPGGAVGLGLLAVTAGVAALAERLAPYSPLATTGPPLAAPGAAHLAGTDDLGRDLLSGVIFGTRTSLLVAASTGALILLIGLAVGAVSGYLGGLVDDVLMRTTELFQVLPRFFLAIMVIALFGPGLDRLVIVLGVTSWPLLARVVRAQVLSLREREYVLAAVATGASGLRVLVREVIPNAIAPAIAYLALLAAEVLLVEASLGFLGLGDPSVVSLGYLAGQAQRFLRAAWWMSFFPGMAVVVIVLALNLVGDALTDALGQQRVSGRRPPRSAARRAARGPRR